jgi:hypothetical protein
MPAAPKTRGICALLLLLILAVPLRAYSASPPPHKTLAPHSPPEEMARGNGARYLSRGEILQAIRDDLARKGIRDSAELRPEDLRIQLAVSVSGEDAGLQVKRIGFDPTRRETIFQLWTSKNPHLLPFQVVTKLDPQTLGLVPPPGWKPEDIVRSADRPVGQPGGPVGSTRMQITSAVPPGWRTPELGQAVQGSSPAKSRPTPLARPGRPATLVMFGHNSRITTTVIPLESGSKGQVIRVRDPANARLLTAEVVAEGLLQTSF